ncbi:MAG: PQQ-binding-like beta-propeller repeat protein [Candidatus Bathyarchaeia archaeon]
MSILINKPKKMITLLVLSAMAVSLFALPAIAQPGVKLKTYPLLDAIPNPVGVGQQVLIRFGILQQLPTVNDAYEGLTVTITKPDGSTEMLGGGPLKTDSTGSSFAVYTPNQVGTYKLKLNFPEQVWKWGTFFNFEGGNLIFDGTTLLASTAELDLIVQQEPLPTYPGMPLPSEYWTRPIDPQLREWATISGNWVARPDNSFALYNDDAPETAHVLWAKKLTTGGLTGGYWGPDEQPVSSETGDAYAGKFIDSVVMHGVLYYNRDDAKVGSNGIVAVDLHTGEELWFRNNTVLSFGQILYFNSYNYDGVFDYLWDASAGTTWKAYDPFTGEWIYTMTNMPSGTRTYGPSGEILIYQIDYTNCWLALWNSTAAGQTAPGFAEPAAYGSWGAYYSGGLVHGSVINAADPRAYSWNVTIPKGLTAGSSFFTPILKVYPDRVMSIDFNRTRVRVWALNTKGLTKTSTSTSLLFDKTWNAPAEWLEGSNTLHYVGATNEVEGGVIAVWSKELRKHYGFSVENGNFLWETESEHILDAYGWGNVEHTWYFAYGKLYSTGVGGIVYAYDLKTGKTVWTHELNDPYNEPVTGNNWWGWIMLIADGKVYVGHLEHSAEMPLPRGAPFVALNATTGEEIFRVNGMFRGTRWGGNAVIGDSIIATMDTYDQRIYAIGKGPSKTTVEAKPEVAVHGGKVLVKGSVLDVSPGTKSPTLVMRFPNGVPAVADESMSDWMLYVYKQFPCPANVKGVEVTIEVLDPNGNYYEVARATSDGSGFYSATFTPPVPGKYTIIARFQGSKAYYGSYAETAIYVEDAPPATPPPTPPPESIADIYFVPAVIGIILAIVVATIINIVVLRKRS